MFCRCVYLSIISKIVAGKWKFENNQPLQKCNNSQNQTENVQSPQMMFKSYPEQRQVVQAYVQPTQTQQYYTGNVHTSGYPQQLQGPSLTITQLNYQPGGYQQFAQTQPSISTTNIIYETSNHEKRYGKNEMPCRYFPPSVTSQYGQEHPIGKERMLKNVSNSTCNNENVEKISVKKSEVNSEGLGAFEYTIQPEQLVKSLCDDREHDSTFPKMNNGHVRSLSCGSPATWTGGSFLQRKQFEDNEFTKFLAQGCLQAEAIAIRNQNRPCFKNIKHLCTRTRTDILKPKTTVANIHSQGIPWATKDFIFAFIRLINCWHILRGYLENDEGSLGKIDTALTPEIREKYFRWQNESKDLLRLLNNLFINLDKGVTIQNAEIFSKFNNLVINNTSPSYTSPPLIETANSNSTIYKSPSSELPPDSSDNSPLDFTDKIIEDTKKNESFTKGDIFVPPNVPGILRVKEIFNDSKQTNKFDETAEHKEYIKPGTYDPPESAVNKEKSYPPDQSDASSTVPDSWETLACSPSISDTELNNYVSESHLSPDNVWKNAIKTTGSFIKRMMNNENAIRAVEKSHETNDDKKIINIKDMQASVTEHCLENGVKENVEGLVDSKKTIRVKKHVVSSKGSNRKNLIATKIFKKRSDDRDVNHNKGLRYKNGNKSQTKYLCKKHEVNKTESNICEKPKQILSLSPTTVNKFERIMNELWLLPFSKYVTFEVNAEYVSFDE